MKPTTSRPYSLAASIVCADMLRLGEEIDRLNKAAIDYIHFDVMDGVFVPRYGLHPEILTAIRSRTMIPLEVHMMVQNAEAYIDTFAIAGATHFTVHAETTSHLHRVIKKIGMAGMTAGVALNPATSLDTLEYVLDDIGLVMLMAINPGIVGHRLIPQMMDKIRELKNRLSDHENILIGVDGGVTPESAPEMLAAGANLLVCGTSTIFKPDAPVDRKIQELRHHLDHVPVTV